jgi:hydrogenase maturation protease
MKLALSESVKGNINGGEPQVGTEPPIAVLGVGNILLRDDGFGVHIIRYLGDKVDLREVSLIDAGTAPDIFSMIGENIEKLIIVDAADGRDQPGTIYRLGRDDIESMKGSPVSLHEIGLGENLQILKLMNPKLKNIVLIGVQVADINPGVELSKTLAGAMSEVTRLILDEIAKKD